MKQTDSFNTTLTIAALSGLPGMGIGLLCSLNRWMAILLGIGLAALCVMGHRLYIAHLQQRALTPDDGHWLILDPNQILLTTIPDSLYAALRVQTLQTPSVYLKQALVVGSMLSRLSLAWLCLVPIITFWTLAIIIAAGHLPLATFIQELDASTASSPSALYRLAALMGSLAGLVTLSWALTAPRFFGYHNCLQAALVRAIHRSLPELSAHHLILQFQPAQGFRRARPERTYA